MKKLTPEEKEDQRKHSPQAYKRKKPGKMPLNEKKVHLLRKVYNRKTKQWETKWVVRQCGIKRAAKIIDHNLPVVELSIELKMSPAEVQNLRNEYAPPPPVEVTPGEPQLSEYDRYVKDVYDSYNDAVGGTPLNPGYYYTSRRLMEVEPRVLTYVEEKITRI